MPHDARILGLSMALPDREVSNADLAARVGGDAGEIERRTDIKHRFYAKAGEGPSDLALRAAQGALAEAGISVADLGLIIFATMSPDVCFPGAACYLQAKLGAGTIGALDVRAQSAGLLCALELAMAFATNPPNVLVAAGEVISSGLDESPRGRDLTPRFGDGAAVMIVGPGDRGPRVRALRWCVDGTLVERFWCEYPASRRYPHRITREEMAQGLHYPRADLSALAPIARQRMGEVIAQVLDEARVSVREVDLALIDYIEPSVARMVASDLGIASARSRVPTAELGHVFAAGLPIALAAERGKLASGARVLLAAAGPGLGYGAALLEM